MKFGVAYYPEQWPEERWAADAQLMAKMGIDVVRIGEFAWWRLEPRRERIDTGWLEDVVDLLNDHGLSVMLGTPTAAPPPWLFYRHPNILPQQADGRRWGLGSRRHVCLNNPAFNKYARRIVTELARTFRDDRIWAWQIDNELGLGPTGRCYCDECEKSFRRWLKRRYGTIDRLNRMWGTSFWSQGFSDWHEIPAPRRTVCGPHPSLALDYSRFISAQHRAFVEEQREIIRDYASEDVPITVNEPSGMDLPHLNLFSLAGQQDAISLDNYPTDSSRLDQTALGLDMARSLRHAPFWVTEQQAGATLVGGHAQQPRPGQLRLWTYQAAARGAELITYFRWRTAPAGQEMHWYGLFDADGTPRRRLDEVREAIRELKKESHYWENFAPEARVAIVLDYDSAWALDATPLGWDPQYFERTATIYGVLRRMGLVAEFVPPDENLSGYDLVVAPMQFITTNAMAKRLKVYVHDGGTLLISAPAGYKGPAATSLDSPPPGPLSELLGVEVSEHDVLGGGCTNSIGVGDGQSFEVDGFASVLKLRGARTIASYTEDFYADSPAVTALKDGRGTAIFAGAAMPAAGWKWLLSEAVDRAGVPTSDWSAEEIEVVPLKALEAEKKMMFVLNHSDEEVQLELGEDDVVTELLREERQDQKVTLSPYGVALLQV